MYFKRIDIHGFKSFAEPVSIEFDKGITCIVGPNGSGKSNISDAIRWVLGEQSPKTLRGGKMEDVIFAGTASRKSRGMAEVVLVIDNTTGILPIDYSEVAITRRVFRSGESEYYINGNQCRLKDIRELIMDTGIGVDGYSLIGQGKIADIVSNKTESRREIFEEAAGIVKYRSRKAEAEKKLEATSGNLERVNDIVSEIESRIDGLREASEKAKEYLALKESYKSLEINIILKNIESLELKNEYLKDDIIELSAKIDDIKEEKQETEKVLEEAREKSHSMEGLLDDARKRLMKAVEELNEVESSGKIRAEKLAAIERDRLRLSQEVENINNKIAENAEKIGITERKRGELDKKLLYLRELLENEGVVLGDLESRQKKYSEAAEEGKQEILEIHGQIGKKSSELSSLEYLRNTLEKRKEAIISEDTEENEKNEGLRQEQDEEQKRKNSLENEIRDLNSELEKMRTEIAYNIEKISSLKSQGEELRVSIGRTSARKKTIEEMESNYEGYNHAVKYVMKAKFDGVHGVVADLIEVPTGFEVAIETALGASMQNVMCSYDREAQVIIKELKAGKHGRITMLPLNTIKGNLYKCSDDVIRHRGFQGVGSDCIKFDSQYKQVMEYLLGRVLIVDKLENAVELSKKVSGGLRFVTLEGEVINSGGAITGGAYKNNTANLLERKTEIAKLETQLSELEKKYQTCVSEYKELKADIDEKNMHMKTMEGNLFQKEKEFVAVENRLKNLLDSSENISSNASRRDKELKNIAEEQESAISMENKIKAEVKNLEHKKVVAEQLVEENLLKLENLKNDLNQATEKNTSSIISVNDCEKDIRIYEAELQRLKESSYELEEEAKVKLKEGEVLDAEEGAILNQEVSGINIAEKEAEKKGLERYIDEIVEEKTKLNQEVFEKSKSKDALDDKVSSYQNQKYEVEIKQAKNETQLENYKNKLWDEFEVAYIQAENFRDKDLNMNEAMRQSREFKSKIKALGEVNIGSIEEYAAVSERYEFLTEQKNDILEALKSLKNIIEDMDKTIRSRFKENFDLIGENFEIVFKELFGGGSAMLVLEDESRPLESGIEIVAQPPGKKLQNLNLLSGGEKTMTAIALMFAVLRAKPTPFCILDEVEAALDDANIDRFAKYLKNFQEIQFALVTHQKATMEHADVLYGVTMPEHGISKVLSLKLGDKIDLD